MTEARADWFFAAMEATWPPAASRRLGPFLLREGAGGGQRVSAATAEAPWTGADLEAAEAAMPAPLFLIRPDEAGLDAALAARSYRLHDPVVAYAAPVAALAAEVPPMAAFAHWPPLEIARALWAEAGIGAARLAVMARAAGPKAAILGRIDDHPAGVAYVACAGEEAMVHALEVREAYRRRGIGRILMQAAAGFAAAQGAQRLSLAVTERNMAGRALYERLGMVAVSNYHYRAR